jgi:P27 family predicted phage terminase small subunit
MGSRGPVPKADSFDTKHGRNTYHRKTPPLPAVDPSEVVPPKAVKGDRLALAFWKSHVPRLIAQKMLRPEQSESFGMLCQYHSEILTLKARVDEEGPVIETKQGPVISPAARLLQQTRKDWQKLANDFGLTPAAEARIPKEATDGKEAANPLTAFGITG